MWQMWILYLGFPLLIGLMYFGTTMYTSDQLEDMLERGDINWVQHTLLYEKMMLGEYKLYPKFIQRFGNKKEDP